MFQRNKVKSGYLVLLLIQLCQCTNKTNKCLEASKIKNVDICSFYDTNMVYEERVSLMGISIKLKTGFSNDSLIVICDDRTIKLHNITTNGSLGFADKILISRSKSESTKVRIIYNQYTYYADIPKGNLFLDVCKDVDGKLQLVTHNNGSLILE